MDLMLDWVPESLRCLGITIDKEGAVHEY